jgi:CheY-like chemotaxis protein
MAEGVKKKTILVVDDDLDFLTMQRIQLEAAGYTVHTAESVDDALKILDQGNIDAAVVDLMMEQMDAGFTLCYQIKKRDAGLPVILVTAVANETGLEFDATTEEERSWVKADTMLAKPVRFEQLKQEIDRLTEK